jgi:hypothetical protein
MTEQDCACDCNEQVGSRMGKCFLSKLDADEKHPSIVREASRVLVTLWAEDPCPEVRTLRRGGLVCVDEVCLCVYGCGCGCECGVHLNGDR